MSAEAGPGPSTMASGMVPVSARTKVKKRVINLVNPADPLEFSNQSMSPNASYNEDHHTEDKENVTPPTLQPAEVTQAYSYTPLQGVKGILRPTGTPGSGNGVRFFPKNKFRVITPNQSALPPTPKAVPSPSNSFFSQLLAVTLPSMSPRRLPEPKVELKPDESWEQPGEEGEVSLVASTASGDRTRDSVDEVDKEDSWNGEPEVHSSPLTLPTAQDGNVSRESSFNGLELPSAEIQLPEDMSNLLSADLTAPDPSLCADEQSATLVSGGGQPQGLSQQLSSMREMSSREADFWNAPAETSAVSALSSGETTRDDREDSNPTIRRQLSPLPPSHSAQPSTPTPVARPFDSSSVFADMSAEQAELTWPLTRRAGDDELDSNFASPARVVPSPAGMEAPRPGHPGDITEFFDCTTMTLSPPDSSVILRASSSSNLIVPTQALFDAQAAHTTALTNELELYRGLAKKLQLEVTERDTVLAKLNVHALEAEVLYTQVQDLRQELASERAASRVVPVSPVVLAQQAQQVRNLDLPSDRTFAAQSEAREFEIRLVKALAETESMARELSAARAGELQASERVSAVEARMKAMEEDERDRLVQTSGKEDEIRALREELDDAHRQMDLLSTNAADPDEVLELRQGLEAARGVAADFKAKENEVRALREELESAHEQLEEATALRDELDQIESKDEELQAIRLELDEAHRQLAELEEGRDDVHALRAELESAHQQLDEHDARKDELAAARGSIVDLKRHVVELTEVKLADEEEIERLLEDVEKLSGARKRADEMEGRVVDLERQIELEVSQRRDVEKKWTDERASRSRLEYEIRELKRDLGEAQEDLQELQNTPVEDPALRAEINRLRAESASKDLEIVTLQRRKAELKEDREMLNIALDSKQQELELIKRKFAVRGVAGSTPLGASRKINAETNTTLDLATPMPSKGPVTRRRSSLAFETPLPSVPKTLLHTPAPRHGVQLHPSTRITNRVMRRVGEENEPPRQRADRRESMLA
ncbi:hypothetical protein IAU60_006424 [Kwoniella sp. DSM 27419]